MNKAAEIIRSYQEMTAEQKAQFFALVAVDACLPKAVREIANEGYKLLSAIDAQTPAA